MNSAVESFLSHFSFGCGNFVMQIPTETFAEAMLRKYEAGDPEALEAVKLSLGSGLYKSEKVMLAAMKQSAATERAALRSSVKVHNKLGERATAKSIEEFSRMLGDVAPELVELYQQIGWAQLYADETKPEDGILFYPISEMKAELENVRDWLGEDEDDFEIVEFDGAQEFQGMPPWFDELVAFAGVGRSAERFLLACGGPYKGCVFAFDHDPLGMRKIATSVSEFLSLLYKEPTRIAEWVGIFGASRYEPNA